MKKITEIFVLAIASMVALSSCEKQNAINNENTVLKASFEDMTKTALGTEYQVLWSATDKITFFNFDGTANDSKTTTISDNGLTAEFTFDGTVTGDVALFPANSEAEYEEGNISTILPTTQYPVEGGFDPKANIALSKTVDGTAKFYNACTLIGFTIRNNDIKSITLGSDKAFAGDCVIYMDGTPKFSSYEEDPSDLVLEADFENGKTYYAVIFPQSYGTFELAFERADGKVAKFVNYNLLDLSAKRNCITNIFDMEIPDSKWKAKDYVLVEEALEDWRGDYLVAYSDNVFMDGSLEGGKNGVGKAQTHVAPEDNLSADKKTVSLSWGDEHYVTIEAIDDEDLSKGYVIKSHSSTTPYFYQTTNANGMACTATKGTAAGYPITIEFTSSSDIKLKLGGGATGAVLRYNNTSGSTGEMFRYYKNGGQSPIYLYKKQD